MTDKEDTIQARTKEELERRLAARRARVQKVLVKARRASATRPADQ